MTAPVALLREAVFATHERLLADFGGASGVRDSGVLDSALARPENLLANGQPSNVELAAACAFEVVKNRPFIAGNKRTGFTIAIMVLERNGETFTASEVDATIQTLALAAGELDEAGYADWLKANCTRK